MKSKYLKTFLMGAGVGTFFALLFLFLQKQNILMESPTIAILVLPAVILLSPHAVDRLLDVVCNIDRSGYYSQQKCMRSGGTCTMEAYIHPPCVEKIDLFLLIFGSAIGWGIVFLAFFTIGRAVTSALRHKSATG